MGKVAKVPVINEGEIVPQHRVALTLAVDHRVVNGKYAADFLSALAGGIEAL